MEGKRLLILSEILLFVVFTTVLFFTSAFFEPLVPLKYLIKEIFPSLLIASFFLFLCFKLIEYYHYQILNQKRLMETLNLHLYKLSSDLKIEKMFQNCLEILIDFYKGDIGLIVVIDEKLKKFISTDVIAINVQNIPKEVEKEENYTYITLSPNRISSKEEEKIKKIIYEYSLNKCKGIITLPISSENETKAIGIVGIYTKTQKEILSIFNRIKTIVEIFLTHLNLEIENSILHEQLNIASITDPSTDLYNRRYFSIRLKEEFSKAKREGYPISIMISDLDNFKKYVDSYGHPMGDIILKEVANVVKISLRETDIICKFGGDEFAYLLPFSTSIEAKIVAERVKNNIENFRFLQGYVDENVSLTLSFGIASFPEHGNSENEILAKADNALFKAKSMGKNKIMIYEEKGG
ncbi:MAG: GGDEF domain-containing protein [Candidatus Omnitrophica bacterium]|nr:GGDEF domain-containing protein [Candidatus Omnitrophota bacterium]